MSNREVNPLASQVNILFGKNGGRCAYPECGATLTMDSRSPGDRPRNVGKVAHITAASPDGPRYDASLTSAERRAETNLILLCGTHHDQIDYQPEFHTTEWLKAAKAYNETRVQ